MDNEKLIEALTEGAQRCDNNEVPHIGDSMMLAVSRIKELTAQFAASERQRAAAVEAVESVAHSGGNFCEFCGANCCDAGLDDPETFQCGGFKWRGPQEAGEGGG